MRSRGSGNAATGGFRPAATNAWIAQAVDWVSEPPPGVSSKPPSGRSPRAEVGEPSFDRASAHPERAQGLDRRGGVVRVGPRPGQPRPASRARLAPDDEARRRGWSRDPGLPEGQHAPEGRVERGPDRARRAHERTQTRDERGRRAAGDALREDRELDVRRRLEIPLVRNEVRVRRAGTPAPRAQPEHRPGGQARRRALPRLGEAAACAPGIGDGDAAQQRRARRARRSRRHPLGTRAPPAHMTSVLRRRAFRSSNRRNSGPTASASTRLPAACAPSNQTPRPIWTARAAHVCGKKLYHSHRSINPLKAKPSTKQTSAKGIRRRSSGAARAPTAPQPPHASICHGVHGPWPRNMFETSAARPPTRIPGAQAERGAGRDDDHRHRLHARDAREEHAAGRGGAAQRRDHGQLLRRRGAGLEPRRGSDDERARDEQERQRGVVGRVGRPQSRRQRGRERSAEGDPRQARAPGPRRARRGGRRPRRRRRGHA